MAKVLNVVTYPDPFLKKIAEKVEKFDGELKTLTEDMFETMYEKSGIGLAAPQIGVSKRIVVIDLQGEDIEDSENDEVAKGEGNKKQGKKRIFINPEIIASSGSTTFEEGCLSVPGYREVVKRKEKIKVKYQDIKGNEQELEADGLLAICLQHEIDHLNGLLFVDQISKLKKTFFKSWFKKNGCRKKDE